MTPSFEPKYGKFMAYNHDKSIIIVDTQNWAVKKTLTDEKVHSIEKKNSIFPKKHAINKIFVSFFYFQTHNVTLIRMVQNTAYVHIQNVENT